MKRSFLIVSLVGAAMAATVSLPAFGSVNDLKAAFENGGPAKVLELLKTDPQLLKSDMGDGMTPLHSGAFYGYEPVVDFALKNGVPLDLKDRRGQTPAWFAVSGGRPAMLRKLMALGADLSVKNGMGMGLLAGAAQAGTVEVVRILLEGGARVDEKDNFQGTPVHHALYSDHVDVLKLLLEKGAALPKDRVMGMTALHFAATTGCAAIHFLLDRGYEIDSRDDQGRTPLMRAVALDNTDGIRALVARGADVDMADNLGETPLHVAARKGSREQVSLLAEKGAKLDAAGARTGRTPLQEAALRGYSSVVELLLARGADKNAKDKDGRTALSYALKHGNKTAADILRKNGAEEAPGPANFDDSADLKQAPAEGEAVIWYLKHSGWAIRTRSAFLVFDYRDADAAPDRKLLANGHIRADELKGLPVYVFVSHEHGDHFDPQILGWRKDLPGITYVFGFEAPDRDGVTVLGPRRQKTIGPLQVTTTKSANDSGVGFAIRVDGLTIFHAGDHMNASLETKDNAFFPEIDFLAVKGIRPDLSFLGYGTSDTEALTKGIFYAVDKLKIKACLPMHADNREWAYRDLADIVAKSGVKLQVGAAACPGDRFFFSKGKLTN